MNSKKQFAAIICLALLSVTFFAASRGDSAFAQAHAGDASPRVIAPVLSTAATTRFAVIGDYGYAGVNDAMVAAMVNSWSPDFIITVGDNNYDYGAQATIDPNIGQYYSNYIYPYTGTYSSTATTNKFFPVLGNHDWGNAYPNPAGANPYLAYFPSPINQRYYDFVWGPVHFFGLDSDPNEPDGITSTSKQAAWLERRLAYASEKWRVVYMHHPPYSSGTTHGSTLNLQWPYQSWGATAVLAGHEHNYERIVQNGFPYFVNGLGGRSLYNDFGTPVAGSAFRFWSSYGAMLVTANDAFIQFDFFSTADPLNALDTYTVTVPSTSNRTYLPMISR